jgi:hypothetical protein
MHAIPLLRIDNDRRPILAMSQPTILPSTLADIAHTAAHSTGFVFGNLPHLIAGWANGGWGTATAVAFMLVGGFLSNPFNTPMPFLEGLGIAGGIMWLRFLECFPVSVQTTGALLVALWMVSYLWIWAHFLRSDKWRYWGLPSFIEIAFKRKPKRK